MTIAAFDPGLSGAVAITLQQWIVRDLPIMGAKKQAMINGVELASMLRRADVSYAVIEHVHAFPHQGISSTARFMITFGQVLGVVQALEIPYELVQPAKWKREMRLAGGDKEAARQRALELFPGLHADLSLKKHHNRAEALLLARWWSEKRK